MLYVKGDIRDATEDCIAHGCNCQGVMGSGVALAIKNKWPDAYKAYVNGLHKDDTRLGMSIPHLHEKTNTIIVNLLTQEYFGTDRRHVNYAAIVTSLVSFIDEVIVADGEVNGDLVDYELKLRIAIPMIGAGLGGGDWEIIETLLEDIEDMYTKECDLEFVVYYID